MCPIEKPIDLHLSGDAPHLFLLEKEGLGQGGAHNTQLHQPCLRLTMDTVSVKLLEMTMPVLY